VARKKTPAKTEVDTETPKTDETLPAAEGEDTPPVADATDTLTAEAEDTLSAEDAMAEVISTEDGSIDLPEPARDDEPDTSTTVAVGDDPLEVEADDAREDTPADITPDDHNAEHPGPTGSEPTPDNAAGPTSEPAQKRGGFFPMVLGGVIAAGIGFVAALGLGDAIPGLGGSTELSDRMTAQEQAISELQASVGATDLEEVGTSIDTNITALADLSERVDTVATQLSDLTARVTELEDTSITESVSEDARAAYEEELARLEEAMRQQREEVQGMVAQAQEIRNTAAARSSETQARAAVTNILAALNNGDAFAEPLDQLAETGTEIPQVLSENADGVATLADLRDSFPAAARDALAVTRGTGNGSVADFFKTQLGVRSLSPKEGDDPDAVLSRAEAAVASGDIQTALTEIEALPPEAMAKLADWKATAETRLTTVEAANGLMTELNSN
jgi:hypothetical protein